MKRTSKLRLAVCADRKRRNRQRPRRYAEHRVTPQQVQDLLREFHLDHEGHISIETISGKAARARFHVGRKHLRPGDTVSGPTLMALADVTMYAALLGEIGLVPLAVTTSLNINFLRKPAQRDVIGEAKLLKVGKRLAVGEVTLFSDGDPAPVAHVTCTYSIPPRSGDTGE